MTLDSYQGALIGGAVGDALGAATEGYTAREILDIFGGTVRTYKTAPRERTTSHLKPGQYTDDTEMSLALARSIIDYGGFDVESLTKRFIEWYNTPGFARSRGPSSERACLALNMDRPWYLSGVNTASDGSAMRAPPLGLLHGSDSMDQLLLDVYKSTIITHRDYRAVAGTAAVAASVIYAREHKDIKHNQFIDFVADFTRLAESLALAKLNQEQEDPLSARLENLKLIMSMPRKKALEELDHTSGCYVCEVVPAAFYHYLTNTNDFHEAIVSAANAGGDTDTLATIVGALSGANLGLSKIPEELLEDLEDRDEIMEIAAAIWKLKKTKN